MADKQIIPAADFQALPIEMIVSTPLVSAVKAQAIAAQSTLEYVKALTDVTAAATDRSEVWRPKTANFDIKYSEANAAGETVSKDVVLNVPLLSMVPVPHLRIDSITTHFKYEISQVVANKAETQAGTEISAGLKWLPFVEATLKGNVSSRSSEESTTNRSGMMEITVHASEAPIPEGLSRLLSMLAKMVDSN